MGRRIPGNTALRVIRAACSVVVPTLSETDVTAISAMRGAGPWEPYLVGKEAKNEVLALNGREVRITPQYHQAPMANSESVICQKIRQFAARSTINVNLGFAISGKSNA